MSDEAVGRGGAGEWAHEIGLQVAFRDCDALGHVNHTIFLRYMEDARTQYYMRVMGITDPTKLDMILAEVVCTYHAPANFMDRLRVGVRPTHLGNKSFTWSYRVWNETTGQPLATGRSVMVSIDYATGATKRVPDSLREECLRWIET